MTITREQVAELFRAQESVLLAEVQQFRAAAEAGTLGDHAERGFLMEILLALGGVR